MTESKKKNSSCLFRPTSEIVEMPEIIKSCSGIRIYGRRIKSILFSTDVSIIANNNADAVLAVYPFTPAPTILTFNTLQRYFAKSALFDSIGVNYIWLCNIAVEADFW